MSFCDKHKFNRPIPPECPACCSEERDDLKVKNVDLKKQVEISCMDWAEACIYAQKVALKYYPEKEVYGDSYYVPGIEDLIDLIEKKIPPVVKTKSLTINIPENCTPENIRDNKCGLGTDYETFYLMEHLAELSEYYGMEVIKQEIKDYEEMQKRKIQK